MERAGGGGGALLDILEDSSGFCWILLDSIEDFYGFHKT